MAEKFLVERYLRNKPLLNLRLRGFNYADEHTQERAARWRPRAATSGRRAAASGSEEGGAPAQQSMGE